MFLAHRNFCHHHHPKYQRTATHSVINTPVQYINDPFSRRGFASDLGKGLIIIKQVIKYWCSDEQDLVHYTYTYVRTGEFFESVPPFIQHRSPPYLGTFICHSFYHNLHIFKLCSHHVGIVVVPKGDSRGQNISVAVDNYMTSDDVVEMEVGTLLV